MWVSSAVYLIMFSHIFQTVKYEIVCNKYWICIPNSNSRGISPGLIFYLVHSTRLPHIFCFLLSLCHQVRVSQSWFPRLRCLIYSRAISVCLQPALTLPQFLGASLEQTWSTVIPAFFLVFLLSFQLCITVVATASPLSQSTSECCALLAQAN